MINIDDEWKLNIINSNPAYEQEINIFKQPDVPKGTSINTYINFLFNTIII